LVIHGVACGAHKGAAMSVPRPPDTPNTAFKRQSVDIEAAKEDHGFTGQRGNRRGGMLDKPVCEESHSREVMASKHISVAQLLHFYRKNSDDGRMTPESSCWDVLRDVILKDTQQEKCCYMDIALVGSRKAPECMVSHWMGLNFRELVLGVVHHATGNILSRDLLEKKAFAGGGIAHDTMEKTYWICMFAGNYHQSGANSHPMYDDQTLGVVLGAMKCLLVVLDPELVILKRTWCLFELWQAHALGKPVEFSGCLADRYASGKVAFDGIEQSLANDRSDRDRIYSHVEFNVGLTVFNQRVGEMFLGGAHLLAWRAALVQASKETNLALLQEILDNGGNLDCALTRIGETALIWAVQNTQPKSALVPWLLEHKANPDATTLGGWSVLHLAVHMGNQAAVSALLESGAAPGPVAHNGRTPLIDAAERSYGDICALLVEAGADISATDDKGLTAGFFVRSLTGEEQMTHRFSELVTRHGWQHDSLDYRRRLTTM